MNTFNYHIQRSNVQTFNVSLTITLKLVLSIILNFCLFCSPLFTIYFGLLHKELPYGDLWIYFQFIGIFAQLDGLPILLIGVLQLIILVVLNCISCRLVKEFNENKRCGVIDSFQLIKKTIIEDFKRLFSHTFLLIVFLILGLGLFVLLQYLMGESGSYGQGDYFLLILEIIVRFIPTLFIIPLLGYIAISANYTAFIKTLSFGEALVDSFKIVRTNFKKVFFFSLAVFLFTSLITSLPSIIFGIVYSSLQDLFVNSIYSLLPIIVLSSNIFKFLGLIFFYISTIYHSQGNNGEQLEKELTEKINNIEINHAE